MNTNRENRARLDEQLPEQVRQNVWNWLLDELVLGGPPEAPEDVDDEFAHTVQNVVVVGASNIRTYDLVNGEEPFTTSMFYQHRRAHLGDSGGIMRRLAAGLDLIESRQGLNVEVMMSVARRCEVRPRIDDEALLEAYVVSRWGLSDRIVAADVPGIQVLRTPSGAVEMFGVSDGDGEPEWTTEAFSRPVVIATGRREGVTVFIIEADSPLANDVRDLVISRYKKNALYRVMAEDMGA